MATTNDTKYTQMKHRPLRVAGKIHRILADSLQKEVLDPEAWKIIVTNVTISPDLRNARVYFTSIGSEAERIQAEKILTNNTPFLKRALARNLRLRFQPKIEFVLDEELLRVEKVEDILDSLKAESKKS
ncbi:MAG: 30S ribosome-binding factor RbfA [Candidatus Omnitrophica bacterium]|nr:30S ribosome-binding factor RbfA [Candidatus Omnitrophota bacterium]